MTFTIGQHSLLSETRTLILLKFKGAFIGFRLDSSNVAGLGGTAQITFHYG